MASKIFKLSFAPKKAPPAREGEGKFPASWRRAQGQTPNFASARFFPFIHGCHPKKDLRCCQSPLNVILGDEKPCFLLVPLDGFMKICAICRQKRLNLPLPSIFPKKQGWRMETVGRLLTPEERQQTQAHFSKNKGKHWDVHDMAEYVQKGFAAVEADEESSAKIADGIRSLGGARVHE